MWGSLSTNHNGRILLSVIEAHDFVVLNTSVPTHYIVDNTSGVSWICLSSRLIFLPDATLLSLMNLLEVITQSSR